MFDPFFCYPEYGLVSSLLFLIRCLDLKTRNQCFFFHVKDLKKGIFVFYSMDIREERGLDGLAITRERTRMRLATS